MAAMAPDARPGCIFDSYPSFQRRLGIARCYRKEIVRGAIHPDCRHPQLVQLEPAALCGVESHRRSLRDGGYPPAPEGCPHDARADTELLACRKGAGAEDGGERQNP